MLVLTRKLGEKISVGDDVTVTIVRVQGKRVALGIHAPEHVRIIRQEIVEPQCDDDWELALPEVGV